MPNMAIKYTNTKGSVIEFDTVEEFQAFVNAYKSEDANAEVDMENLPIGTLVKVVDNSAGHCHDAGEILPITEIDEGDVFPYRLDGMPGGWVAVEDIEFVSFPEEEESTSGDGGLAVDDIRVGDSVMFLVDHTDVYGDTVQKGHCAKVRAIHDGDILLGTAPSQSVRHEDIPTVITKIDEDEDDSEIKAGDIVIATEDELDITEGVEYEIKEFETGALYFLDDDGDIRHVSLHEEILRKKIIEAIDEPKFEVGGILRCNKGSVYETEGKLYEVLAIDIDGDAVYMDDGNSVSYVNETDIPERFEIL